MDVYLVFASLIIPAIATRNIRHSARIPSGYACGAIAYLAGLNLSTIWDLPPGAIIVWMLLIAGSALGALLVASDPQALSALVPASLGYSAGGLERLWESPEARAE